MNFNRLQFRKGRGIFTIPFVLFVTVLFFFLFYFILKEEQFLSIHSYCSWHTVTYIETGSENIRVLSCKKLFCHTRFASEDKRPSHDNKSDYLEKRVLGREKIMPENIISKLSGGEPTVGKPHWPPLFLLTLPPPQLPCSPSHVPIIFLLSSLSTSRIQDSINFQSTFNHAESQEENMLCFPFQLALRTCPFLLTKSCLPGEARCFSLVDDQRRSAELHI